MLMDGINYMKTSYIVQCLMYKQTSVSNTDIYQYNRREPTADAKSLQE